MIFTLFKILNFSFTYLSFTKQFRELWGQNHTENEKKNILMHEMTILIDTIRIMNS
jgi:hypothetical protein